MNTLILYFILANLGLAAFYLFFRLLLQKDTFFAGKRFALLTGILLALTYPLLDLSSWIQRSDSLVEYADVLRSRLPEIPGKAVKANEALPTFTDGATQTGVTTTEDGTNLSDAAQLPNESAVSTTMEGQSGQELAIEQGLGSEIGTGTLAFANSADTSKNQSTKKASIFSYFTVFDYLLLIYILTTVFLLTRIVRQLFRILHCRRKAERIKVHDQWVYVLKGCLSPFSFFGSIFMDPDAYSDKNLLEIIVHERAHIKQGHSYDVVFSELMCAFFWINPFAWLLKRSLRENLEFLADRDVIKNGVDPKTYQYKLLQLSCHRSDANLANHFNVSQLKKRIVMMNKKRTSWEGLGKYALSLPLFAALLLTAYAWGQQHETEAKEMVATVTADSKVIAALTVDEKTLLAQNAPEKPAAEQPVETAQGVIEQIELSVDGVVYKNLDEKTVEVVSGKSNNGKLVIPSTVMHGGVTCTVTSIGDLAFHGCRGLTSISIPRSVTSIGYRVFTGCSSLTSITIPSSVTSIGHFAFEGCSSLTSITIPSSVTFIGKGAFNACTAVKKYTVETSNPTYSSVDDVLFNKDRTTLCAYPNRESSQYVIPSSVTSIEEGAFWGCSSLTSVTIPSSVTSIGGNAFRGCSSLTSLTIPSSVTSIGNGAFEGCSSLTSLTIPSSVTSIGLGTFRGCSALKSLTIPSSVTSIGEFAFEDCSSLTSIIIPSSLKSIGNLAFTKCTGLTSISIPSSVTSIGGSAFQGCSSLTSITIPSSVTSIGLGAFLGCSSLSSLTIPSSVTSIRDNAFGYCSSLTSITIPSSVTSIGDRAFYNCSALTSITIPSSVTSIGNEAFYGCTAVKKYTVETSNPNYSSLKDVLFNKDRTTLIAFPNRESSQYVIPSSVKTIGYRAFYGNTGLTSITIPSSVTSIGDYAFWGCTAVKKFTVDPSNPNYSSLDDVLFNKDRTTLIAYPNRESSQYVIPSSVTTIEGLAFRYCTSLTSLTIPSSVTSIGDGAFEYCSNLTSLSIPSSVKTIGGNTFLGCSSLTSLTIPSSVTSIGGYAFNGCKSLTSLTIPSSVTSIGEMAFAACSSLTSIVIPSSVKSIGSGAFIGCRALKKYTVDTSNPNYSALDDVLFNKDGTTLIAYPNRKSSQYVIPPSVTSIRFCAFCICSALTSITIPTSVTSIGNQAFDGCSELSEIHCQKEVPLTITSDIFNNVGKTTCKLYVPKGSLELYSKAKVWGEFATIIEE